MRFVERLHPQISEVIAIGGTESADALLKHQNGMFILAEVKSAPLLTYPFEARMRDGWPKNESVSDSKTSAGMDRTDDIKKGIYQSLKIGTHVKDMPSVRTAIISNLPAYRHGQEYIEPFINMLWGLDEDLQDQDGKRFLPEDKLRRAFDFIITLEELS